jgi:hypothetical protein
MSTRQLTVPPFIQHYIHFAMALYCFVWNLLPLDDYKLVMIDLKIHKLNTTILVGSW